MGRPAGWITLGAAAAAGLAVSGSRVGPLPGSGAWWLGLPHSAGGRPVMAGFYAAMVAMVVAWLGLGTWARAGRLAPRTALAALPAWGVPLLLGPPLFSRDVYSYMAQGLLADRGLDPYTYGPLALGHGWVLGSIAPPWRATPAPYGPLFMGISRAASWAFGRSIVVEVTAFRVLTLAGVALLAVCLPPLARRAGADPGTALWLAVLSPVALFSFVASGHNDALMVGLVVAGVALVFRDRPGLALLACSAATTVKVSAAAAVAFVAVLAWRSADRQGRWRQVPRWAGAVLGPPVLATWASGLGWGWLRPSVLAVPGRLLLGYAPAPAVGLSVFHGLHLVGVHLSRNPVVTGAEAAFGLGALVVAVRLALGSDRAGLPARLGVVLLVAVLAGPSLWPWYLTWSVALLAVTAHQRSWALAAAAGLTPFLVAPAGTPVLRGPDYFFVAGLVVAFLVWVGRRQRWRTLLEPSLA